MGKRKHQSSKKSRASISSSSNPKAVLKHQSQARQFDAMEIEKNKASLSHLTDKSNKEANASKPAVHLDDEYESKRRKANNSKEHEDRLDDANPWGNSKGIIKKIPKTNSQGNMNVQRNFQAQILEKKFQPKEPQLPKGGLQKNHVGFLRQGLENLGNTCFCNALFQCLFDVPQFRESILRTSQNKSHGVLLGNLCNFFENLKQRSQNTQKAYSQFVKTLFNKRKDQFKIGTQGDSCILFRALLEELAKEGGNEDLPYLRIFNGGDLVKSIECPECHEKKIITEKLKILDVKDVNFHKENKENFFQPVRELRVCWNCRERGAFICRYEVTEFPEILVIKVHETVNYEEKAKVFPKIEFERKNLGNERYGLLSSVVNELRGEKGYHSMELSYQKRSYFVVDDHREIIEVKLEDLKPEPKLLFYKKL